MDATRIAETHLPRSFRSIASATNLGDGTHQDLGVSVEVYHRVERRSTLQVVERVAECAPDDEGYDRVLETSEAGPTSKYLAGARQASDHQSRSSDPYQDVGDERAAQPGADVFRLLQRSATQPLEVYSSTHSCSDSSAALRRKTHSRACPGAHPQRPPRASVASRETHREL
jgi:hypothetical protein